MKKNAKAYREVIALIGVALLATTIARTSQARDFADKSKFAKIEIPADFGSGLLPTEINPRGEIVGTYFQRLPVRQQCGFMLTRIRFAFIACATQPPDRPYGIGLHVRCADALIDARTVTAHSPAIMKDDSVSVISRTWATSCS